MKVFLYTKVSRKVIFFLIFVCSGFATKTMDLLEAPENKLETKFLKKFKIWDNDELVRAGTKKSESFAQSIIITPNEKGLLIAKYGQVEYVDTRTFISSKPHELIMHSHKKYCPIIAAAMTKNVLRVVSLLNNVSGAECIISRNHISNHPDHKTHNIFKKTLREDRKLEAPAQAIALSADGEIIAIAFKDYIGIIDLLTGTYRKSNFMPHAHGVLITAISVPVDVSFGPHEKHVAAVSAEGVIDVKKFSKTQENECSLTHFKDIRTGEELIEGIHLNAQELLYVTQQGEVKIVDVKDWIEHSRGLIKNRIIAYHVRHKAAVDQNFSEGTFPGTIHWRDCPYAPEKERAQIQVHRENGTSGEDLVVSLSDLPSVQKKHNFITEMGQEVSATTQVLLAALRGNCVAALVSDGNLYVWQLPEKYKVPTQEEVTILSQKECYADSVTRKRSSSTPVAASVGEMHKKEKNKSEKQKNAGSRISFFSGHSKESIQQPASSPRRDVSHSPSLAGRQKKTIELPKNHAKDQDYIKALIDDIRNDSDDQEVV